MYCIYNNYILIQIGDPSLSSQLSDELMKRKGHYVQAINHPTVPRGQEKLRIAPTPHHTRDMMDVFVADLVEVWKDLGIPLKPACSKVFLPFNCNLKYKFQILYFIPYI
jgi:5-aminolevulinate synthase